MSLQVLVSGISIGCIYALLALAIVLIYKSTDIVNFAQGEMAMLCSFVALVFYQHVTSNIFLLVILSLLVGAVLGGLIERTVIRPLQNSPELNSLIVTIGLWITIHYGAGWIWGFDAFTFPSITSQEPVLIGGASISLNSITIILMSIILMVLLYIFLEHTKYGTAMRATSMNPEAAKLMGISPGKISMIAWAIAAAIGATAAVFIAPITFVDVNMMFEVLIKGLAGAVVGGFTSLPGAVVGGIMIGVIESFSSVYLSSVFSDSIAFVAIVVVLMLKPEGLFGKPAVKKV